MKQTYIENIRKACIASNPEIVKRKATLEPCLWDTCTCWNKEEHLARNSEAKEHTIRLADVLLAIGDRGLWSMSIIGDFVSFIHEPVSEQKHFVWHLKDDLTLQSEETLKFISDLLTTKI